MPRWSLFPDLLWGLISCKLRSVWQWQMFETIFLQFLRKIVLFPDLVSVARLSPSMHMCSWLLTGGNLQSKGFIIKMSSQILVLDILTFCFFLFNLSQLRASGQGRLKFCRIWRQARFTLWQSGRQGPACVLSHIRRWVLEKESKVYVSCDHFITNRL